MWDMRDSFLPIDWLTAFMHKFSTSILPGA